MKEADMNEVLQNLYNTKTSPPGAGRSIDPTKPGPDSILHELGSAERQRRRKMRELISKDTGKPGNLHLNTDIAILPDGEGGIYLSMCWHEMVEIGSIATHLPRDRIKDLLHNITAATEDEND